MSRWVNFEALIECDICASVETIDEQRIISLLEQESRFREMGWSVGSNRDLCPEHRRGADADNPTPNNL